MVACRVKNTVFGLAIPTEALKCVENMHTTKTLFPVERTGFRAKTYGFPRTLFWFAERVANVANEMCQNIGPVDKGKKIGNIRMLEWCQNKRGLRQACAR